MFDPDKDIKQHQISEVFMNFYQGCSTKVYPQVGRTGVFSLFFFAQFTIQPGSPLKFLGAQVQVNMHVPKQVEAFWVTSSLMVGLWMTL
jgi:hypothetical protein